jgi:nucleoid DNA-binding protein
MVTSVKKTGLNKKKSSETISSEKGVMKQESITTPILATKNSSSTKPNTVPVQGSTLVQKSQEKKFAGKNDLVRLIHEVLPDMHLKDIEKFYSACVQSIFHILDQYDQLRLVKFATFNKRERPERMGRNPKTGAQIIIPPSKQISVKISRLAYESHIEEAVIEKKEEKKTASPIASKQITKQKK